MKPKELTPLQALRRSLWMVAQAAPLELRNLALLNLVTGTGPSIALFLGKVVIDEAARLMGQATADNAIALLLSQPRLLWCIAAAVLLNLIVDSIDSIGTTLFAALRDRVQGYVQGKVLNKVANFDDIALFETPELLNLLELTEKGLQRIQRLSFIVAATFVGVFIFVPSVLVSVSISWWVPLVLIAASIPSIIVEMKHIRKLACGGNPGGADPRDEYLRQSVNRGSLRQGSAFVFPAIGATRAVAGIVWTHVCHDGASAATGCRCRDGLGVDWRHGCGFPYIYVLLGVLRGAYTLGDLALYTGIILQVRPQFVYFDRQHGRYLRRCSGNQSDFSNCSIWNPQLCSGREAIAPTSEVRTCHQGLQLQDVSFIYPGSDKVILSD
ncbi:ABC transporter ATP-binding protein, partial [bacterium]|nr:ABC transporter ATP-binding protein [bacterium]